MTRRSTSNPAPTSPDHPRSLLDVSSQTRKKTWKATVTHVNARSAPRCRATSRRLASGDRTTHPIAAAPMTFGTAKTTNPQRPKSRTNSTGKNIPMHQVHEHARYAAQPSVVSQEPARPAGAVAVRDRPKAAVYG